MTYCVGMLLDSGLIMIADTRTNAGVDNISTFRKLHTFEFEDRFITIATAGSLSVTQATIAKLQEGVTEPEQDGVETLRNVPNMFRASVLVGKILRETETELKNGYQSSVVKFSATMLIGGKIGKEDQKLFLIYDLGNSIQCTKDTPYLQIGELKYGKPILDRALTYDVPFNEAVKIGLISFDSTMRSNLAVGMPLDIMMLRNGEDEKPSYYRVEREDEYFSALSSEWSRILKEAKAKIPRPPFVVAKS